ncbi:hypothetical protein [Thalassospira xiamenensis]|uniref:Uncharacterized protein n=1 Tax=Thalassospira xiamenensis TaxID=220697 RepID=A0A285TUD9_9PROT|nr:hypothetical protein [Thalassospira xiamenensis]SOC27497.1 hypothetical protein SAMN05428964_105439 [Thalassospira xiamenensis]
MVSPQNGTTVPGQSITNLQMVLFDIHEYQELRVSNEFTLVCEQMKGAAKIDPNGVSKPAHPLQKELTRLTLLSEELNRMHKVIFEDLESLYPPIGSSLVIEHPSRGRLVSEVSGLVKEPLKLSSSAQSSRIRMTTENPMSLGNGVKVIRATCPRPADTKQTIGKLPPKGTPATVVGINPGDEFPVVVAFRDMAGQIFLTNIMAREAKMLARATNSQNEDVDFHFYRATHRKPSAIHSADLADPELSAMLLQVGSEIAAFEPDFHSGHNNDWMSARFVGFYPSFQDAADDLGMIEIIPPHCDCRRPVETMDVVSRIIR